MKRLITLLLVVAMLVGLVGVLSTRPAEAAAFTIFNMSASGAAFPTTVGATVTVGGSGVVPGAGKPISVYLAKTPGAKAWVTPGDDGDLVATATADSAGAWGTSFVVPERRSASPVGGPVAFGVYDVFLQSGADSATFTGATGMNVKPDLGRSPTSAAPGTPCTLKGTGFQGSETGITANFDTAGINKVVASGITATSRGSWTATFNVPDRGEGAGLNILAQGANTTGVGAPTCTFEILSGVLLRGRNILATEEGRKIVIVVLTSNYQPVPGTTVRLVDTQTGTIALTATANADGFVVLQAPQVTGSRWYRTEADAGTPSPDGILVLDEGTIFQRADINSDGIVDIYDLVQIGRAFNTRQ